MKPFLTACSIGSLALNAVLIAMVFAGRDAAPTPEVAKGTTPAARPPELAATINDQVWSTLRGEELQKMVQQLRDSGFPIDIVRAILGAQIRESFAARRKAIDPDADTRPYWKSG